MNMNHIYKRYKHTMEEQVAPLLKTILATIKNYEKEKSNKIRLLEEINRRQKEEMTDFLKVSFAARWKKESEEMKKRNIFLEEKISNLTRTNQQINSKLDKLTENCNVQTQTDPICIKTTKGALYHIENDYLINKIINKEGCSNKIAGNIITVDN